MHKGGDKAIVNVLVTSIFSHVITYVLQGDGRGRNEEGEKDGKYL